VGAGVAGTQATRRVRERQRMGSRK